MKIKTSKKLEIILLLSLASCSQDNNSEKQNPALQNLRYLSNFAERISADPNSQEKSHYFDTSLCGEIKSDYQNLISKIKKFRGGNYGSD